MAFSLNRAQVIGNITREPEVRMAGSQKVASFSVATNSSWIDKMSGQRKEKAEFHNIVAWGKLAEVCEKYLRKGTKVYIEGRMQTRDWQGEDGVKRYRSEIVAENMIMLDKKGDSSGGGAAYNSEGMGDGASSFQPVRQQRSVRSRAADENGTMAAASVQEEEVSVEDLPF